MDGRGPRERKRERERARARARQQTADSDAKPRDSATTQQGGADHCRLLAKALRRSTVTVEVAVGLAPIALLPVQEPTTTLARDQGFV